MNTMLNKMLDILQTMAKDVSSNTTSLEEHMRRTEMAEERINHIEEKWDRIEGHLDKVEGMFLLVKWSGAILAVAWTIIQIYTYIK